MRVIWAFHEEDVGPSGPTYHGANRGRKSLRLLIPGTSKSVPPETSSFDLLNMNVSKVKNNQKQMHGIANTFSEVNFIHGRIL